MANNTRFVFNIRQIALTNDILKLILPTGIFNDKAALPGHRGVGTQLTPISGICQAIQSNTQGTYDMTALIDNTSSPVITDNDLNTCDTINRITGMTDLTDTSLNMILKPDGLFD